MMWGAGLVLLCCLAARVTSQEMKVNCEELDVFPPYSNATPSILGDLQVKLVTVGGKDMMNISWAINIDASINYLTGIRIVIFGEATYHCDYQPVWAKADLVGSEQKWFHYLVDANPGFNSIQAANLPFPLTENSINYKSTSLSIPFPKPVPAKSTTVPSATLEKIGHAEPDNDNFFSITTAIFGVVVGLVILSSCYIIYKRCGANVVTSLGFNRLPTSPVAPVPVLVVYPAEDPAFQRAVLALVEFLQRYGGCSVAVDFWQQRKIAEQGPMRWLAEKAKNAHRVLVVCPKSSSLPSCSPPNHTVPQPSIPASAHDLYPLVLNMVAGHAKSASDLAKFSVVQLGVDKKPSDLALELRACRTFGLMKDLNKLCRSLHAESRGDKKISDLIFGPRIGCSEKYTVKLREEVEKLGGHRPHISIKAEPSKSVVSIV